MISKPLLIEVLGDENYQKRFKLIEPFIDGEEFYYRYDAESQDYITMSVYKFTYKCKLWAYERGFIIESGFHKNAINTSHTRCFGWVSETIDIENTFNGTTEFDVVVKSCEWIKQEVLNDK